MKIGIVIPDKLEYAPFLHYIKKNNGKIIQDKYYDVCSVEIDEKEIFILQCEIGKVRASAATVYLLNKFNVDIIINTGLAGSPLSKIKRGAVCAGSKYVEADFDLTALNYKLGEKSDKTYFNLADKNLLKIAKEKCNLPIGIFASGDFFLNDEKKAEFLSREFNLSVFDMESAAVADVCKIFKIPFISIRKISDDGSANAKEDYGKENEGNKKDLVDTVVDFIKKIN
ncbi:MAG: 5'-methylthioadenosine/S-adenosylhomocysteine nucleosidase [Clostridia bacterium]|nr:5'-methylthioadenosine/S-adenosylhomocysteine nucleosidase [Clostridia bacterium]